MTATAAPTASPAQIAFGDLGQEIAATTRVLERVPEGKFDWTPHGKSMSLGRLASHVAELPLFAMMMVNGDEFDFATGKYVPFAAKSTPELVDAFAKNAQTLRSAIEALDWPTMERTWTLRHGDHVIVSAPKGALIRSMGINHIVHHRAQLGVYLRLLDVPVPGLYGPSADERNG